MSKIYQAEQVAVIVRVMRAGRPQHVARITCHEAGCRDHVGELDITDRPSGETVVRMFRDKGWIHVNGAHKWRCAVCQKRRHSGNDPDALLKAAKVTVLTANPEARSIVVVKGDSDSMTAQPDQIAAAVAKVPRETKLKILDALRGAFDEATGQFLEGDDSTIAKQFNVGPAVVAALREEWLGPIKDDPVVAELRRMLAGCNNAASGLRANLTELEAYIRKVEKRLEDHVAGKKGTA